MSFYEPDWATGEPSRRRPVTAVVGGWLREESFYRDVVTRSLSILITGGFGYLAAVALGYVGRPPGQAVVLIVTALSLFVTSAVAIECMNRERLVIGYSIMFGWSAAVMLIATWLDDWMQAPEVSIGSKWFWIIMIPTYVGACSIVLIMRRRRLAQSMRE
ncbi:MULTISPECIES: hypothetical protein [Mycobacteriaceae]|uniref:hypothetical protein n=1 Tax=Mycobacteriaceae TaxID=1762 RepID=UPI0002D54A3F|nr:MULTISPECIES: hypothetical protein [Mycobacteriaceae]WBP94261.1 hypothetical protein O7W24_24585 [Mycolicibacterium neoaurum]WBS06028.1 hypothetical protein O6072_14080 [Mycolicibacterium neoaurum]